jgi:hypothetical protein
MFLLWELLNISTGVGRGRTRDVALQDSVVMTMLCYSGMRPGTLGPSNTEFAEEGKVWIFCSFCIPLTTVTVSETSRCQGLQDRVWRVPDKIHRSTF